MQCNTCGSPWPEIAPLFVWGASGCPSSCPDPFHPRADFDAFCWNCYSHKRSERAMENKCKGSTHDHPCCSTWHEGASNFDIHADRFTPSRGATEGT